MRPAKHTLERGNQKIARKILDDVMEPLNEVNKIRAYSVVEDLNKERLEDERFNLSHS